MRLTHWLFKSRKKKCKHCCLFCKFFYECEPMAYDKKVKKLDRIDQKIISTTKKLDKHIEDYKQIAKTMR